jgi:hypothetical protein
MYKDLLSSVSFSGTMGPCGDKKYFLSNRVGHHGGRGGGA